MAQPVLRDGDIILIRARWWLRWLCKYDHAALLYSRNPRLDGEARRWYSIESGFSGVRDWPFPQARPYDIVRPFCMSNVAYDAISVAMTWRGQPYAAWHLPAIFWRMMQSKVQRVEVRQARVCTELVRDAYKSVGLDITPGVNRPTPDDIAGSKRVVEVIQ